jgi:hypothetical protein
MEAIQMDSLTDDGLEIFLSDPLTKKTVDILLEAGCTSSQIHAWMDLQERCKANPCAN